MSPDGRKVAFVVMQAFRDSNNYRSALYVVPTDSAAKPIKLVEEKELSMIRWIPGRHAVSYLTSPGEAPELWQVAERGGSPRSVLKSAFNEDTLPRDGTSKHQGGVVLYEWSSDGRQIAFTASRSSTPQHRREAEQMGIPYNDENMQFHDLVTGAWSKEPSQVWVYDVSAEEERLVWQRSEDIMGIAWSPNAKQLAVTYLAPPLQRESLVYFNSDIGLLSLADGAFLPVATTEAAESRPMWSPDSRQIAFGSDLDGNVSLGIVDIGTGRRRYVGRGQVGYSVSPVGWSPDGQDVLLQASGLHTGGSKLYRTGVAADSVVSLPSEVPHLSECTVGESVEFAACIGQSTAYPPDPFLVNLRSGTAQRVATLNPEFRALALGEVTELHWTNKYGAPTNGFLVKPVNYVLGRRYPTLVITYGFQGRFIAEAEWITSYPVQAFAAEGFAILLVNEPVSTPWHGKDFARGSLAVGYGPLASVEQGVQLLVERGIADSTRLGILGWSYGCFLAEFAITHSRVFKAASVGAGGDYNPGIYWLLSNRGTRENYEQVMGGPPYGETLSNWLRFSPAFNTDRVEAPVLMEFSDLEAIAGLEMFTALRRHRVPVDLVIYPGDGHVLTQPQHRYYSMRRNLDWFAFWLQERERGGPERYADFQRWRSFRSTHAGVVSAR